MATIDLPSNLLKIFKAESFTLQRHRWNTNEEIASILISFDKHKEWLPNEVQMKPKSGSMILYSRKKVRYRRDGYCWKKRKDGKTTREDHMKLKVQGIECIYGCYVHSAILSTFHRRCYWLLQNPDIVLVHYLNVPYSDDNKIITPIINISDSKKKWTKEELLAELKPMFFNENDSDFNIDLETSTYETIEELVQSMMTQHRAQIRALEEKNDTNINTQTIKITETNSCAKKENELCSESKSDLTKLEIKKELLATSPLLHQQLTFSSGTLSTTNSCPNFTQAISSQQNFQYLQPTNASNCNLKSSSSDLAKLKENTSTSFILNLSQFDNGNGLLILNNTSTPTQSLTNTKSPPLTFICNRSQLPEFSNLSKPLKKSLLSSSFELKPGQTLSQLKLSPTIQSSHYYSTFPASSMIDIINGNCVQLEKSVNTNIKKKFDNLIILPKKVTPSSNSILNQSVNLNLDSKKEMDSNHSTDESLEKKKLNQKNFNCNSTQSTFFISKNQNLNESDSINLNPMELIDNDISNPNENLFNLENFDMLTEFSTLDNLNDESFSFSSSHSNQNLTSEQNVSITNKISNSYVHSNSLFISTKSEFFSDISDFSPDWCYSSGGAKILLIGSWNSHDLNYSVLFGDKSVTATLIQSGVLRCISPPHEIGCVHLQVACETSIISNFVIFEYKNSSSDKSSKDDDYFAIDDNILKFSVLERFEILETHLSINFWHSSAKDVVNRNVSSFENKLISRAGELMNSSWLPFDDSLTSQSIRKGSSLADMSLLHLVAALGYHTFAECLLKWKTENPSVLLDMEVDAFSCDKNECTPLMWALARGHKETACLLYRWRRAAINLCNNQGFSPLHIARQKGYFDLVKEIEKIEIEADENDFASFDFKFQSNQQHPLPSFLKKDSSLLKLESHFSCAKKSFSFDSNGTDPLINLSLDNDSLLDESCTPSSEETEDSNFLRLLEGFSSQLNSSCDLSFHRSKSNSIESSTNDTCNVLTFAEHIIAAMPDRIKAASESLPLDSLAKEKFENEIETQSTEVYDFIDCDLSSICSEKRDINSLDGQCFVKSNSIESFEKPLFFFEQNCYRHSDLVSPTSSPTSSCIQSPSSLHNLESPSPPPSAEDLCEFFQASGRIMEKGFSNLTLSDLEQRELYEAAKVIQKAYRTYKGRKRKEQEKEKQAAIIIQNSYRRYKQYKQMTKAAQIIQTRFRNYCEHKRFKKSNQNNYANSNDASYYNAASESERKKSTTRETMSLNLKRSYSQRRQNQAARKIQQFLRQSKNKLQKERALQIEKENKAESKESL